MNSQTPHNSHPGHKTTALMDLHLDDGVLTIMPKGPNVSQRESEIISEDVEPYLGESVADTSKLRYLVMDMSQVTFMSSMGLGMCIAFRNKAGAMGAKALITGLNDQLRQVLSMMRIDKLYQVVDDPHKVQKMISR